jgi:uncharacterized membrane protein
MNDIIDTNDCFGEYIEGHEECIECEDKDVCNEITLGYASDWWYLLPLFLGLVGGILASIIVVNIHIRNKNKVTKLMLVGIFISLMHVSNTFGVYGS